MFALLILIHCGSSSIMGDNINSLSTVDVVGPNAISVSLSPHGGFIMVGLAARRLHWHLTSRQMMAQIFRLTDKDSDASDGGKVSQPMIVEWVKKKVLNLVLLDLQGKKFWVSNGIREPCSQDLLSPGLGKKRNLGSKVTEFVAHFFSLFWIESWHNGNDQNYWNLKQEKNDRSKNGPKTDR